MFVCAAVFYTLATIIRLFMARKASRGDEKNPQRLSFTGLRSNLGIMFTLILSGGLVTWILINDGVRDIAFNLSFNLVPLYYKEIGGLSIQQIGWLESIFGIFMMISTYPAGWLADKRGERLGITLGFLLLFAALMIFLEVSGFWGFGFAWAVLGLGVGLMSPAYQSLISKAIPEKVRGTAFGLFDTSLGLVSLPAPAIGAQLWERFSPRTPFILTAWAVLLSIIPIWTKFKLPNNHNQNSQTHNPDANNNN